MDRPPVPAPPWRLARWTSRSAATRAARSGFRPRSAASSGLKPTFGLISHFGIGFGSDQSIDYTGPMTRTVEDARRGAPGHGGIRPVRSAPDPRRARPMDVLSGLADGVSGLRIGVVKEGFDGRRGGSARPGHGGRRRSRQRRGHRLQRQHPRAPQMPAMAQNALGEGPLSLFKTGFFGAFTRTYYPASIIAADQPDVGRPRRRAGAAHQDVADRRRAGPARTTTAASTPKGRTCGPPTSRRTTPRLQDVDVLVMPTCADDRAEEPPAGHLPGGARGQPRADVQRGFA